MNSDSTLHSTRVMMLSKLLSPHTKIWHDMLGFALFYVWIWHFGDTGLLSVCFGRWLKVKIQDSVVHWSEACVGPGKLQQST